MTKSIMFLLTVLLLAQTNCAQSVEPQTDTNHIKNNNDYFAYEVIRAKEKIELFWQDEADDPLLSFNALSQHVAKNDNELKFAMNGGMYTTSYGPLGLYIENGNELKRLNEVKDAKGNFYLQPNGVFYFTDSLSFVTTTENFQADTNMLFATQSGPMLLIDNEYHPAFNQDSKSLNIRNGVGILPNGNPIFLMSKQKVNFYSFATYFKELGCKNALYLDGFVSKIYCPEEEYHSEKERFGVMIGVYQ